MTRDAAAALGRLAEIAQEIEDLTAERRVLVSAALQAGARASDVAGVTGLARSTVSSWAKRR